MDANTDADADEEGEATEGGDVGKDKELIGRGGDDTVDVSGGNYMGRSEGRGEGPDIERPPRWPLPQTSLIYH